MNSFRPIIALQLLTIVVFAVLKHSRATLAQAFPNEVFEIFLYSFPNFAEGVVGFLIVATLLTMATWRFDWIAALLPLRTLCTVAILAVGTYVISQELGLHHLGGAQVYDPYDIAFSVAGLVVGLLAFVRLRPTQP